MKNDLILVERGAVFSRARSDPREARLRAVSIQLLQLADSLAADDPLAAKLRAKSAIVVDLLQSIHARAAASDWQTQSIEKQLARASSRYDELPSIGMGQMQSIDRIRQHILTEKQNLMHELRRARVDYERDLQRLRSQLAEAYAELAAATRTASMLAPQPLELPSLTHLMDFLPLAPRGEEVLILEPPSDAQSFVEARLP